MDTEAPSSLHPARHFSVSAISRSEGRSAVRAAAYICRTRIEDERTGLVHDSGRKSGLLRTGLVNWDDGEGPALWNALEKVETRINARVGRELRIALPKELPLEEQVRLVRSFSLWLKDQYDVACEWALHAPRFHDEDLGERLWGERWSPGGQATYEAALFDPALTNLNFHAHILVTGRAVDRASRSFGRKVRELDHIFEGPAHIELLRHEWQTRTNRKLEKIGSSARIDLRSYETMAAAGDAPEDMVAQEHMGEVKTTLSRKAKKANRPDTEAGRARDQVRQHNDEVWSTTLVLRALRREKFRQEESARIASEREAARRAEEAARKGKIDVAGPTQDICARDAAPVQRPVPTSPASAAKAPSHTAVHRPKPQRSELVEEEDAFVTEAKSDLGSLFVDDAPSGPHATIAPRKGLTGPREDPARPPIGSSPEVAGARIGTVRFAGIAKSSPWQAADSTFEPGREIQPHLASPEPASVRWNGPGLTCPADPMLPPVADPPAKDDRLVKPRPPEAGPKAVRRPRPEDPYQAAIRAAQEGFAGVAIADEFSAEIDPETDSDANPMTLPAEPIRLIRKSSQRQRQRGS